MLSELKQTVQRFYDGAAGLYERRDKGLKRIFHDQSELMCLSDMPLGGRRMLDVGTGAGRVFRFLEQQGSRPALSVGMDLSMGMLRTARQNGALSTATLLLQADAESLPFSSCAFDALICLGLLEYVSDLRPFVREFFRVLTPGGWMLFTCRNMGRWSPFPNKNYPVADHGMAFVQNIVCECGFRIVKHETIYHLHGRWIWALTRASKPMGLDLGALRVVLAVNSVLRTSVVFRNHGKTQLVLAHRPEVDVMSSLSET